ncbi:amidohydrolase family protein [Actinomadura viridis]|uniref:TIM-barrel fold metal-dependent hydrolase n=1 Tax=Actinomadura viridis TaxID=58110 RepID=A0A931GIY2_9ACTN|nr:amidohydrolase family protein [Actinomadura viridis]MBG6089088.1 putative TIM-barrel fold metal-dependent hydrolase [Actinomadura viridis]
MTLPADQPIIDTMIGFPIRDPDGTYGFITRQTKDAGSRRDLRMPAGYMFKDVPDHEDSAIDPVALTLAEMDRHGVAVGLVGIKGEDGRRAVREHPDRFAGCLSVDPNQGMDALREMTAMHAEYAIRAVDVFPAGTFPQVAINDKKMYPIYAKCVELGLPIFVCAGVPGPRVRLEPQRVEYLDEVMFDFPELVLVTRHGCEPWTDLAVKLMLKWPNLYYSTSAFAPKYYPREIVDYANTRGPHKIIYGGYFPMGLPLDRIMAELPGVPFKDSVWPRFLHDNARQVLKLP